MTSFYPLAAPLPAASTSSSSSYLPPTSSTEAVAAYLSASRIRTGPADTRPLPEAKRPRSSMTHRRPSLTRCSPVAAATASHTRSSTHAMSRPVAVSSSAQDWVNATLPPTPALQTCTYVPGQASSGTWLADAPAAGVQEQPPAAPILDSRYAHCPTPELTPPEEAVSTAVSATTAIVNGSSTFIKRDDLTAKAIARAASMTIPAQPSLAAKQYSVGSGESSGSAHAGCEKDLFVNGLVGASVLAIESIWGSVVSPNCDIAVRAGSGDSVIPLQSFVKEVLRRSRTSCSTLQLALYYLHKSRRGIREAVSRAEASRDEIVRLEQELAECKRRAASFAASSSAPEDSYPSPPQSPSEHRQAEVEAHAHAVHASAVAAELGERFSALVAAQNSPVLCGRRMFLAALISASKYLQDRNYSNRAWAKISGLPVGEINGNERAFLKVVDFKLHLPAEEFQRWTERLAALASPATSPIEATRPLASAPQQHQQLSRSASTYVSLSPEQIQLAAGTRANGPLTASARQALSRGHSAAAVLGSSAVPSTMREKGFPIATARAAQVPVLMQYREVASPTAMSSISSTSSSEEGTEPDVPPPATKRQLRSLPVRRVHGSLSSSSSSSAAAAKRIPAQAAVYVPSSWSSGGSTPRSATISALGRDFGMDGLELEAVRAH
ncbi:hypothetical protein JCM10908_000299 [Rhodotorula pacifica]|uniref:cyclin family protein n=1 Tax=Rhodotorula pacifica TaxID=1495444 RepID=UPI00317A997A